LKMSHQQQDEEEFHNQPTIVELEDLEQDDETGLLDEHQWNDTRPLRPPPTMTQQQKMSYTFVGIFACLTMFIIIIFAYNTLFSKEPETPPIPTQTEAIMQLIWPPTYCKVKQCIPLNSTKITGFVIEDFKRKNEKDNSLCIEKNFDETKLKNVRSQLELVWPDLLNDKDLWKKNWENHGKCLPINQSTQPSRSEDVYFETILNLYHQKPSSFMNLLETAFNTTFKEHEKMFKLSNVQKELSFKVKERQISPLIDCVEIGDQSFLNSITLCIKDFQFIECEQKNSKCKEDIVIAPYNV
jgi:hypothetical protein